MNILCPKEVAGILGISERTARRLMASQDICSFQVGAKLWRTSQVQVADYVERQFDRYRRAVPAHAITQLQAA